MNGFEQPDGILAAPLLVFGVIMEVCHCMQRHSIMGVLVQQAFEHICNRISATHAT